MLPFVTIGEEQMSVVLDMTSHGLFRVQMLVTTFLPSYLTSFLVDFGRHVMQHIFSSVVCGGFSTHKMPTVVGIV
jgi:hypothetical protein